MTSHTITSLLLNPLGWRTVIDIGIEGATEEPEVVVDDIPLPAVSTPFRAKVLGEVDRLGRRRCRIVDMKGITARQVRTEFTQWRIVQQWSRTGDMAVMARDMDALRKSWPPER